MTLTLTSITSKIYKMDALAFIKYCATAIFVTSLSFVVPIQHFIFATVCAVTVDLFAGIRAAQIRGEAITSKGLRKTIDKFVFYTVAVLLSEGIRRAFNLDGVFPLTYIVSGYIAMIEFKSVLENIGAITGVNAWLAARQYLGRFIEGPLEDEDETEVFKKK